MKIVHPEATIIEEELSKLSVYQRIEQCAAICYGRPAKPTEGESIEFCKSMMKRGHLTTLEMAQVHLVVDERTLCPVSPYIQVSHDRDKVIVSGSIRAFLEVKNRPSEVYDFLAFEYPIFFTSDTLKGWRVRFVEPHEIPRSHQYVAVRVVCSRAISHQLVRHRPFSFLQESQRYCRYVGPDGVTFIEPEFAVADETGRTFTGAEWFSHMLKCESHYQRQLFNGLSPQQARGGLPNDTRTELIMYGSLPMWDHVFELRCAAGADPEIKRICIPLREEFASRYGKE
jgi:thymidylate synthase (FAD)